MLYLFSYLSIYCICFFFHRVTPKIIKLIRSNITKPNVHTVALVLKISKLEIHLTKITHKVKTTVRDNVFRIDENKAFENPFKLISSLIFSITFQINPNRPMNNNNTISPCPHLSINPLSSGKIPLIRGKIIKIKGDTKTNPIKTDTIHVFIENIFCFSLIVIYVFLN